MQIRLPPNSRIRPGKTWPRPPQAKRVKEFIVYRYDLESGEGPRGLNPAEAIALIKRKIFERTT